MSHSAVWLASLVSIKETKNGKLTQSLSIVLWPQTDKEARMKKAVLVAVVVCLVVCSLSVSAHPTGMYHMQPTREGTAST